MRARTSLNTALVAAVLAISTVPALAQAPFTVQLREPAKRADRYGDVPLGAVIRTDERYNTGGLIQGPHGWPYWNYLQAPLPFQNPNLWPDKRPTYFIGQLEMPAGSTLTMHGRFPYTRYFKLSFYKFERNTFVTLAGASLPGYDIEPDPGSGNPYRLGADRMVRDRKFTVHVLAKDPPKKPAERAKNTIYVGSDGKAIQMVFRIYVSDKGYDGAGWGPGDGPSREGPGVTYEGKLADGTTLSAAEVDKRWARPLGDVPAAFTTDKWYEMVNNKDNNPCMTPATAPACPDSQFELFRGMRYTVVGAFMKPAERAKIALHAEMGGGVDPTTAYLVNYISRKFGPVYVFRAKLPTFPNTYEGTKTMPGGQVQYWSVATMASGPSGALWDGVFDMMVPTDQDGHYTIVVSRPEDRPKNATKENGVMWIDWGPGEGLDDPRDRKDWGMLLMRFMAPDKSWEHNPEKAIRPGTEAAVMGPYYPRGYYTTKARFEVEGVKAQSASTSR
jgi:hypothetical protein